MPLFEKDTGDREFRRTSDSGLVLKVDEDGIDADRVRASNGSDVEAGDFALSAGWGDSASVSDVASGSNDTRGRITITSAGSSQAANPTVTLTFTDGAYASAPFAFCINGGGDDPTAEWTAGAGSTTTAVFTFNATPVATETYDLVYWVVG